MSEEKKTILPEDQKAKWKPERLQKNRVLPFRKVQRKSENINVKDNRDSSLIKSLHNEFMSNGLIHTESEESGLSDKEVEDFISFFQDISEKGKSEKDFHPEYYDENVNEMLSDRQSTSDDFENPIVDDPDE